MGNFASQEAYASLQCDQTLELKVAQFSPKLPKRNQSSFYAWREVYKIAQKVAQYLG